MAPGNIYMDSHRDKLRFVSAAFLFDTTLQASSADMGRSSADMGRSSADMGRSSADMGRLVFLSPVFCLSSF